MFPKIVVPPNHPILVGFSIINHPFWGIPIFGNTHMAISLDLLKVPGKNTLNHFCPKGHFNHDFNMGE